MEAVIARLKNNVRLSNRDISFLMSLLDIILIKNDLKFGMEHYLQIQGTSMGSNIFMDSIESLRILPSQYGVHIKAGYRFVDNIFVLWTGSEDELNEFTTFINGIHELLEFPITKDQKEMCFLDVKIIREHDRLQTTLYTKPTDKKNLLQKNSFHAPQTFGRITKGQLIRAKRICSDEREYPKNAEKYVSKFSKRGYKKQELRETMKTDKNEKRRS